MSERGPCMVPKWFFVAVPFVLCTVPQQISWAQGSYEKALDKALATMYAIDYDRAAQQFEEAIRLEPDNPRAYLYLASSYWMKTLYTQNSLVTTAFGLPPDPYSSSPSTVFPAELR